MNEAFFMPIFQQIESSSLVKLRVQFYKLFVRYAQVRASWNFKSFEEMAEDNSERTILHNALIDSVNILARNMEKIGEDVTWRTQLGNDRKVIGDLACYVAAWLGIRQR